MNESRRIDTLKKRVEVLEEAAALAKKDKAGIVVPIVGAILGLIATLGASGITAWAMRLDATPISCADERSKVAKVYADNPNAWIDLNATDPIEVQCHINEFVEKLKHP